MKPLSYHKLYYVIMENLRQISCEELAQIYNDTEYSLHGEAGNRVRPTWSDYESEVVFVVEDKL